MIDAAGHWPYIGDMKLFAVLAALSLMMPVELSAQEEDDTPRPRAFVGRYIQLDPILVPFQGRRGINFDAITVRLVIGRNATADSACFTAPFIHQEILLTLYESGLTRADFTEDNLPKLSSRLMAIAEELTDVGVFESIEVMPGGELVEEHSTTLTNLCK